MTREQNIEIIRKACIKANPDILKLKFGCEVELNKESKSERMTVVKLLDKTGEYVVTYQDGTQGLNQPDELKIIGRPIRLADVLVAMNADRENIWGYYLGSDGYLCESIEGDFGTELESTPCRWNLKNDDLALQPDETLEFLVNILK